MGAHDVEASPAVGTGTVGNSTVGNSTVVNRAVVSIGTNYCREENLTQALDILDQQFEGLTLSSVYESVSQPSSQEDAYYNLVAVFVTDQSVNVLQTALKSIEAQCGRDRSASCMPGQVAMDIDLLLYDDVVTEDLPHQDILECAYVLWPLSELLPLDLHPVHQKNFAELWEKFSGTRELQAIDFVWRDQLISVTPPNMMFQ